MYIYLDKSFSLDFEKLIFFFEFDNINDAFNLLLDADKTVTSESILLISFLSFITFSKIFCLLKSPYITFDTKFSPFKIIFAFELWTVIKFNLVLYFFF